MWGELLSLGISGVGSVFNWMDAANERRDRRNAADREYEIAQENLDIQRQSMSEAIGSRDYVRMIEEMNRDKVDQEDIRNRGHLDAEYKYKVRRQMDEDKEQARVELEKLRRYTRRTDIADEERAFAEEQMAELQKIASGEYDERLSRLYEDRAMKQQERAYQQRQVLEARNQSISERDYDINNRKMILDAVMKLQDAMQGTQAKLGDAPTGKRLTEAEIDNEIGRRRDHYRGNVDRAGELVASIGEAGLIDSGMDTSTRADVERGDIAGRLADEYNDADNRAYDDALAYILGETQGLNANAGEIMNLRNAILNETGTVAGAGIQHMIDNPAARGGLDWINTLGQVGTGILDRDVGSANDYDLKVGLGTRNVSEDGLEVGSNLSRFLDPGSQVYKGGIVGTNENPAAWISGGVGAGGNAVNAFRGAASNFDNSYNNSQTRLSEGLSNFGSQAVNFYEKHWGKDKDKQNIDSR